jgi:hypothetical protein
VAEKFQITESSTAAGTSAAIVRQAVWNPETRLVVVEPGTKTAKSARAQELPPPEAVRAEAGTHFLTVLRWVGFLTVGLIVLWVVMAFVPEPTANQQKVFDVLTQLVYLGVGAFAGLLTGKQLN